MKILNLDNWGSKATEILREVAIVHNTPILSEEYEGVIATLSKTDARYFITDKLKLIASCTTGLDHIDIERCKAKGIKIISLQGETDFLQDVYATAEHTWALIMSLIRKVPFAFDDVKQGNWNREVWQGTELRGKTLGIVGYGRVGQQVAKFAEAFGMKVIAYDKNNPFGKRAFDIVLKTSDIITVHVPLNNETKNMFGMEQFGLMKPTAYFINTSRGGIVNHHALEDALASGEIKGAALDVLEGEPYIGHCLLEHLEKYNNLIITPHIAGNTAESREKTQVFIAHKIKEYIERCDY